MISSALRSPPTLAALLVATALISGCADDRSKIESKIKFELEACQKAEGSTYEIKFEVGAPYAIETFACDVPVKEITLDNDINANAKVGPYTFNMRKDTSDGRWHVTRVTWPELDQARSIMETENKADTDITKGITLLNAVLKEAPKMEYARLSLMELHLLQRKRFNKQGETNEQRAGLGTAQAPYDASVKAAVENGQNNLAAQLHLLVIGYLDRYRQLAEDASVVSDDNAEKERAAIKAVQNEADEAKKKGDTPAYENAIAEIATREKEMEENAVKRVKDAEVMGKVAKELLKRECVAIQAAKGLSGVSSEVTAEVSTYASQVTCPK
ncbi:MAG: hypothetical protein CMH57_04035 [Myxococcales bacterium]|nr:hypothetical protein [Myxococcales bacterium]